jgi:hypothetical protein
VTLNAYAERVIMLSVTITSIMLNVIILRVVMLNVVVPFLFIELG